MIALLLAAALAAPDPMIASARQTFEDRLDDYPSARFRYWVVSPVANDPAVFCGEINEPNGQGGMTGWHLLAINARLHHVLAEGGVSWMNDEAMDRTCGPNGVGRPVPAGVTDYGPAFSPKGTAAP